MAAGETTDSTQDARLRELVELQVRRVMADLESDREKKILETISSQRDFLVGNTKWVVGGFFGLLIVFAAMFSYLFGSQFDDKYFDALIGASISNTVETKIQTSIDAKSEISLEATKKDIEKAAENAKKNGIESINLALDARIEEILSQEILQRIEQVTTEFTKRSNEDLLSRIIPVGAVLSFDLPDGCPVGWAPYSQGAGRVIVGVGSATDQIGEARTFLFGDPPGGTFQHRLSLAEMPAHAHGFSVWEPIFGTGRRFDTQPGIGLHPAEPSAGDVKQTFQTTPTGGNQPHNNMPPYIALHFCKKEAG